MIGCYGAFPAPGLACSGYLVAGERSRILVDCGSGVGDRLLRLLPYHQLTAVILTHLHADHFSDYLTMRYGVYDSVHRGRRGVLPVWAPTEPAAEASLIPYRQATEHRPLDETTAIDFGDIRVSFCRTQHPSPTFAVRVEEGPPGAARSLVYTSDTALFDGLSDFARGADLLLAEANLAETEGDKRQWGHMTGSDAGRLARAAGARRTVITHLLPENDNAAVLRAAEAAYGGSLELAQPGGVYEI